MYIIDWCFNKDILFMYLKVSYDKVSKNENLTQTWEGQFCSAGSSYFIFVNRYYFLSFFIFIQTKQLIDKGKK